MTLKDILEQQHLDNITIYYRTIVNLPDEDDVDLFTGACRWENQTLVSLDGDTYSLNDPITRYEIDPIEPKLVVWYESEWIRG